MRQLVFLLEEVSAKVMLEGLLPRLIPEGFIFRYIVFEGKQDLEGHLVRRLRGYLVPDTHFVVLRDQDAADCRKVKNGLVEKCKQAGQVNVLVRIACHELESWYLADLAAVEKGLRIDGLATKQNKSKYRTPDSLANAAQELEKLTKYSYQKVRGSRAIGPHLDIDNNRSRSFAAFVIGLKRFVTRN